MQKFYAGEIIWSPAYGSGKITDITYEGYPIRVTFDSGVTKTFSIDGYEYEEHLNPTLFKMNPNILDAIGMLEICGQNFLENEIVLYRNEAKENWKLGMFKHNNFGEAYHNQRYCVFSIEGENTGQRKNVSYCISYERNKGLCKEKTPLKKGDFVLVRDDTHYPWEHALFVEYSGDERWPFRVKLTENEATVIRRNCILAGKKVLHPYANEIKDLKENLKTLEVLASNILKTVTELEEKQNDE